MTAFDAHAHDRARAAPEAEPGEERRPTVRPRRAAACRTVGWLRCAVATVRAAGLDEAAQAAVLHGNAERELRRVAVEGGQRG